MAVVWTQKSFGKAVAPAFRTPTASEKNYSQIKMFHKFLYGRYFILLTDHELITSVFLSKKKYSGFHWKPTLVLVDDPSWLRFRYTRCSQYRCMETLQPIDVKPSWIDSEVNGGGPHWLLTIKVSKPRIGWMAEDFHHQATPNFLWTSSIRLPDLIEACSRFRTRTE
ncbi:hypothetical protein ACTXT7_003428 [Hymenolepis weldensis]